MLAIQPPLPRNSFWPCGVTSILSHNILFTAVTMLGIMWALSMGLRLRFVHYATTMNHLPSFLMKNNTSSSCGMTRGVIWGSKCFTPSIKHLPKHDCTSMTSEALNTFVDQLIWLTINSIQFSSFPFTSHFQIFKWKHGGWSIEKWCLNCIMMFKLINK